MTHAGWTGGDPNASSESRDQLAEHLHEVREAKAAAGHSQGWLARLWSLITGRRSRG